MAASRKTRLRSEKFNENITKRGLVPTASTVEKREGSSMTSPLLIGFLFFVLVGSSIFQIIRTAQGGPIF